MAKIGTVAVENKPKPEAPDREALRDEAWEELEGYRAGAIDFMQRFGVGASRWAEKGWQWKEPDWTADPETWPPIAKMLYLHLRYDALLTRANFARHFMKPSYCPSCSARPSMAHGQWACPEHTDWVTHVRRLAADLFADAAGADR